MRIANVRFHAVLQCGKEPIQLPDSPLHNQFYRAIVAVSNESADLKPTSQLLSRPAEPDPLDLPKVNNRPTFKAVRAAHAAGC